MRPEPGDGAATALGPPRSEAPNGAYRGRCARSTRGSVSLAAPRPGLRNLALGAGYLAGAWVAVHATWAVDRAIHASESPTGFPEAALVTASYLPLYCVAPLVALVIVLVCLGDWMHSADTGRRDPLSALGALLALGGYGFVLYGLSGPA